MPSDALARGIAPPSGRDVWHEDPAGFRHGPALRWFPSGQLRSVTPYRHGVRHGRYRAWFANGSVELEGLFDNDEPTGTWRRWYDTGQPMMTIDLVDGVLHGPARNCYPTGAQARVWSYDAGFQHGLDQTWLMDGSLFSEERLERGLRQGERRQWMAGKLVLVEQWVDGLRHGPHQSWSWMGRLAFAGGHHRGLRSGPWKFYDGSGELEFEGEMSAGVPVGEWRQRAADDWIVVSAADLPPLPLPELPPPVADPPDVGPMLLQTKGPTPTVLVSGFLGAGKTTTIRHLLSNKPHDQRWVVYVNEVGEVGIDGAAFGDLATGLQVRELAGGCACCTSNLPFVEGVAAAINELRPDLLVVEPTGVADPATLRASLTAALGDQLAMRAVLCVVDPRRLPDGASPSGALLRAQVAAADVVIGNRWDLASPDDQAAFHHLVDSLPDGVVALETTQGRIDSALLARIARPASTTAGVPAPAITTVGRTLPDGPAFDHDTVDAALRGTLADPCDFPDGWLRFKGLLHTTNGPHRVEADTVAGVVVLEWTAQHFTGPDRIECIASGPAACSWAALLSCRSVGPTGGTSSRSG